MCKENRTSPLTYLRALRERAVSEGISILPLHGEDGYVRTFVVAFGRKLGESGLKRAARFKAWGLLNFMEVP